MVIRSFRYKILNTEDPGEDGVVTELGYGATEPPAKGRGVKYLNLRREKGAPECGPYLVIENDDIEEEYGEPAPDPKYSGFWDNLRRQLAISGKFKEFEPDNLDTFDASVALLVFNEVAQHGGIWAKNVALVEGNKQALLEHPAVIGAIAERDKKNTPAFYHALRVAAGKPDLFVQFVAHGDGRNWAQQTAGAIQAAKYPNMGVSYSSQGEYGNVEDILLPIPIGSNMVWWSDSSGKRVAKSLRVLYDQVNAAYPGRDKSSDGTIGNEAHQATKSEHNPDKNGVVRALDITNSPGVLSSRKLAEALINSGDPRIYYVISDGEIANPNISNGAWRPYKGSNPHDHHMHISVVEDPDLYDDQRPWSIGGQPVANVAGRNMRITATRFNDSQVAYADVKPGWNSRYGVSLPYRFKGTRPRVRVFANGKSIECEIMDIGPWYDGTAARGPFDPYWETGKRPRAESDPNTNGAGIDLTLPADAALGLNGKGLVDWEFVGATTVPVPTEPIPANPPATTEEAFARVEAALADLKESIRVATQPVVQQPIDWGALLAPLAKELLPKLLPTLLPYIIQLLPSLLPMILNGMTQPKQSTGLSPAATAGGAAAVGGIGGLIGALLTTFLKGN